MPKIKICFISETLDTTTGAGRFAYSVIKTLKDHFDIEPIILIERGEKNFLRSKAVLFKKGPLKFILNPLLILIYGFRADIIHGFDGWPWGIYAYLTNRLNRKPFTMTIYGTYGVVPLYRRFQKILMRAAYDACACLIAISNYTAGRVRKAYPQARIRIIKQGIHFNNYQRPITHKKITSCPYVITVGTMKSRKGYHFAIPAFSKLKKVFPDLKFVILAFYDKKDEYYQKIKKMIKKYGLEKDIIWLTKISESELIDLYKQAELFMLFSVSSFYQFEGFGSVNLEAQACGLPVVVFRGSGVEDALIDGETGFLAEKEDIDSVFSLAKRILENKELRQDMSLRAKKFAQSMDWANKMKDYYRIYRQILSK